MLSIRYKRFVPSVFRDLRRQHRLAHPNHWLGSAEHSVRRTDQVFRNQVQQTVRQIMGPAATPTASGDAAAPETRGARTTSASRASADGASSDDGS